MLLKRKKAEEEELETQLDENFRDNMILIFVLVDFFLWKQNSTLLF